MRISHSKHLATTGDATHDVTSVKMVHRGLQNILHTHVLIDKTRNVRVCQSTLLGIDEVALHLTVEAVSHELQGDVGVTVDARALALLGEVFEDFLDIGHVEVAADAEVLCFPVVTAKERVHILHTASPANGSSS